MIASFRHTVATDRCYEKPIRRDTSGRMNNRTPSNLQERQCLANKYLGRADWSGCTTWAIRCRGNFSQESKESLKSRELPKMNREEFRRRMREAFERTMDQVADAVDAAPRGTIIRDSGFPPARARCRKRKCSGGWRRPATVYGNGCNGRGGPRPCLPGNLRRQNPHFVGRREELRRLHEQLGDPGIVGVVTAVHGLGAQGKTELAVAYAHSFANCYPAGLWVLEAEGKRSCCRSSASWRSSPSSATTRSFPSCPPSRKRTTPWNWAMRS